jgi:hypothetical protein
MKTSDRIKSFANHMITIRKLNCHFAMLLLLAALALSAHANELTVGDSVPDFSAKDQFGKLEERARLFGHEARMAGDVLQIRDPNGHWLELELAPQNITAGV